MRTFKALTQTLSMGQPLTTGVGSARRVKALRVIFCCVVLSQSSTLWAETGPPTAESVGKAQVHLLPAQGSEKAPPSFELSAPSASILWDPSLPAESSQLEVKLEGIFKGDHWSLFMHHDSRPITRDKDTGAFQTQIRIRQPKSVITFIAVSPLGKVYSQHAEIEVVDWADVQARAKEQASGGPPPKRYSFSVGLGFTDLSYQQTHVPNLSEIILNTKAGFQYWLKPGVWDLSVSGYFSAFTLSKSPSDWDIHFLGLNARIGYVLPWLRSPWQLTFMAGAYYATTFTSAPTGQSFGYVNIGGPQAYPSLSYTFSSGNTLGWYFKFSPVSDQFTPLALSNREIASGASWSFKPGRDGRRFSIQLDWACLQLLGSDGSKISSSTLSLGAGYKF